LTPGLAGREVDSRRFQPPEMIHHVGGPWELPTSATHGSGLVACTDTCIGLLLGFGDAVSIRFVNVTKGRKHQYR